MTLVNLAPGQVSMVFKARTTMLVQFRPVLPPIMRLVLQHASLNAEMPKSCWQEAVNQL